MTSLADVFVEVRPDTKGFSSELKTSLAKTREAVNVAANLDTKALRPQLDKLKAELKAIQVTKASIYADSAQATAKVKALKADLKGLNEQVKIDGRTDELTAKIEAVKAELASIGNTKARLNIDSSMASAHLKALQAQLSVFDGKDYTANVNVRETKGVNFAFRGISNLTTAIVGLAPVAVPALAAVTAGVGVLGSALAAAGGAGAALGGVMAANVAEFKALQKQQVADAKIVESRNTAVDAARVSLAGATKGTASYKAASARLTVALQDQKNAQGALNQDNKTLNGEFGPLTRGLDNFKKGLGQLTKNTRPEVIGLMGHALNAIGKLLPRFSPLVKDAAVAVNGLVTEMVQFTRTAKFQSILDFFERNGPSAIRTFGHVAGNVVLGVFNLIAAFEPQQQSVIKGVEGMSAAFRRWSAGFGSSNGFRKFMEYARRVLPDVRDLFVNLTEFVGKFVVALGPLAGVELHVVTLFLRGLNSLPPKALTAIAVGITAIVLGLKAWELGTKAVTVVTKVWAAAEWLLNAALRANPIGLVVTALGLLAAGLIYAYKHSKTFRDVVNNAWKVVGQVVGTVWHNIVQPILKAYVAYLQNVLFPALRFLYNNVVRPVFRSVGQAISVMWNNVVKPVFRAYVAYLQNVLFPVVRFLWNNVVKPVFKGLGDTISGVWRNVIKPAFGALKSGLGDVRSAFRTAVGAIQTIWNGLKAAAAAPVRFVVNTVAAGLVKALNHIPAVHLTVPHVAFSSGGRVPGSGNSDTVPAMLTPGEVVIPKRKVAEVGAGRLLDWIGGNVQRFAKGGVVWPTTGHITSTYAGHDGVDINGPGQDYGNPIFAFRAGRVTYAGAGHGYGNAVFEATSAANVVYGHMSQILARTGQILRAGQLIGRVGATGHATGPHLHFGIPGGTYAQAIALLRGATVRGVGGGVGYTGPSLGSILSALNPAHWMQHLRDMGGFGPMLAGTVGSIAGTARSFATTKIKAAIKATERLVGRTVTGGAGADAPAGATGQQLAIAARSYGWSGSEIQSLYNIIRNESGFNPRAENPTSTASGLFQMIDGTARAYGLPGHASNSSVPAQIAAGLRYIQARYGDPNRAWKYWQAHRSYDAGGIARGAGYLQKATALPERVLSPRQTVAFERLVDKFDGAPASGGNTYNISTLDVSAALREAQRIDSFAGRI